MPLRLGAVHRVTDPIGHARARPREVYQHHPTVIWMRLVAHEATLGQRVKHTGHGCTGMEAIP